MDVVLLQRTPFHLILLLFLSLHTLIPNPSFLLPAVIPVDGIRFRPPGLGAFVVGVSKHGIQTRSTLRNTVHHSQQQQQQQQQRRRRDQKQSLLYTHRRLQHQPSYESQLRSRCDDDDDISVVTDDADRSMNNNNDHLDHHIKDDDTSKSKILMMKNHNYDNKDDFWINIGSTITTEACPLLGIKCLGVDYGLVRTGLAMSVGYEPIPLTIITSSSSSNITDLCQTILQYASTYQVQRIIVGLPLHKNGTIAEQTLLTLNFTQQLAIQVASQLGPQVAVLLFDERYTSKMAVAREQVKNPKLIHASAQSLYGTLDATAACIILENYYDDNGIGAHTVTLPKVIRETCLLQFQECQSKRQADQQLRINNEIEKRRRRLQLLEQAKLLDRQQQQQLLHNNTTTAESISSMGKKRKKKKRK